MFFWHIQSVNSTPAWPRKSLVITEIPARAQGHAEIFFMAVVPIRKHLQFSTPLCISAHISKNSEYNTEIIIMSHFNETEYGAVFNMFGQFHCPC